ncbi:MAG: type II toxin-antitoxin system VapC family toxin [Halobacteriota archaeon]
MKLVLDANVIAKWFIEEENTEKAIEIRDNFVKGEFAILEPTLLTYELGNVFWKHLVKSPEDVKSDFKALFDIGIEFLEISTPKILKRIHENAREFGITFYDATYVTLALKDNCKLITADGRLQRKVEGHMDVELL